MRCPKCSGGDVSVIDTRPYDGNTIRRRRVCRSCEYRWSTAEQRIDRVLQAPVNEAILLIPDRRSDK